MNASNKVPNDGLHGDLSRRYQLFVGGDCSGDDASDSRHDLGEGEDRPSAPAVHAKDAEDVALNKVTRYGIAISFNEEAHEAME